MNDIRTYTRDAKGNPTGIIIATKSTRPGMKYVIGWSKTNTNVDKYDKSKALQIAVYRLKGAEDKNVPYLTHKMPHQVRKLIDRFNDRCTRYFK
jgi:hypothetical protein